MADDIGGRIARRRQALRMTQEELAAKLGVSRNAVASWESGKHFPKRKLGLVEEVLGISLRDEPEEPEVPSEILDAIDLAYPGPEHEARRQELRAAFAESARRILSGTGTSAPGAAAGPGRHRRAV